MHFLNVTGSRALTRAQKKFLVYYGVFFLCMTGLVVPLYQLSLTMLSRGYVSTAGSLLETGLGSLETDLGSVEAAAISVYNSPSFRWLSYLQEKPSYTDYCRAIPMVNDFKNFFAAQTMIVDCGIVYGNNIILTTKRLYFPWEDFSGHYFRMTNTGAADTPPAEWKNALSGGAFSGAFIPEASIATIEETYEAITFCAAFSHAPERRAFFFATLGKEALLSRLVTDDVFRTSRVVMSGPDGRVLFDSGRDGGGGSDIVTLEKSGRKRGLRVRVEIPRRVFQEQLAPFRRGVLAAAFACLALGVFLVLFFAQRSARPIREMAAQQEELEREILFERLLHGLVYSASGLQMVSDFFPDLPAAFRIAAVEIPDSEDSSRAAYSMRQAVILNTAEPHLRSLSGGAGLPRVHFSGSLLALLLPDAAALPALLRALSADLRRVLGAPCRTALSETERDIRGIHRAFYEARHLLRLSESAGAEDTILEKKNSAPFFPVELLDTSRLYELLLHGDEENAVAFINSTFYELCLKNSMGSDDVQQIFFMYRYVLLQVNNESALAFDEKTIPVYDPNLHFSFLFAQVAEAARGLCRLVKNRRIEKDTEAEKAVVSYIDGHITDPGLYIKLVTDAFGISENRLQLIVRKWTGKSFLEYVESKRMRLSRSLLLKTEKPIAQIAAECGYSTENSFYKAFRRFYRRSPSDMRG